VGYGVQVVLVRLVLTVDGVAGAPNWYWLSSRPDALDWSKTGLPSSQSTFLSHACKLINELPCHELCIALFPGAHQ